MEERPIIDDNNQGDMNDGVETILETIFKRLISQEQIQKSFSTTSLQNITEWSKPGMLPKISLLESAISEDLKDEDS